MRREKRGGGEGPIEKLLPTKVRFTIVIWLLVVAAVFGPTGKPIWKRIRKSIWPSKISLEYFIGCTNPVSCTVFKCCTLENEKWWNYEKLRDATRHCKNAESDFSRQYVSTTWGISLLPIHEQRVDELLFAFGFDRSQMAAETFAMFFRLFPR